MRQSWFCFAIIDKKKPPSTADPEGELAGMVAYRDADSVNQFIGLGHVIVLPPFQRTHVTTNAVGLLVQYALDSPEEGGLGLRRVEWKADSSNPASVRAATRLGFQQDGVIRWARIARDAVNRGKEGNGREMPHGNNDDVGRDIVILSMCWDDWVQGNKRETLRELMSR
jgi:RimJ/RimL family protein N-acetyltransferase